LRVLDVLLVPRQLRNGVDHVRTSLEHRQAVGVKQRVAEPPQVHTTIVRPLGPRQVVLHKDVAHLVRYRVMLVDLREAIRRKVDVLDPIELVSGVIRRSNPFRDQLLIHLPYDQLSVTEQHSVLGFLI
jgi:hypothetical protein